MGRLGAAWRTFRQRDLASDEILGWRTRGRDTRGTASVTQHTALRHSAWWACLRLRADLISTLPLDAYRLRDGLQIEVNKPPLLIEPYPGTPITEHLYSSTVDLDRYGNTVGVIEAVNSLGQPAVVELKPMSEVSAILRGTEIKEWRICGQTYLPQEIWHEKQYTVGGMPIGLSPLAYAAWTVGGYLSAQQWALDWFGSGASPMGTLRNTERVTVKGIASEAKAQFKAAVESRDIFVTGRDWEWTPATTDAASTGFLESQSAGLLDVCRYLGVPGDMIDASSPSGSITYASITQRNLQLLIMNLNPAIIRRETAFSRALPRPRFVKFNTDALLRMDPAARESVILSRVNGRTLAPSEARALDNLPPFTPEQLAEIDYFAQLGKPVPAAPKTASASPWEAPV